MKRPLLALSLVPLVFALAPSAAAAVEEKKPPPFCKGSWTSEGATCSFIYRGGDVGTGLWLEGDPVGAAAVRLEKPGGALGSKVILTCQAAGQYSGCGAAMTSTQDIAPIGTRLTCIVEGQLASGTYGCSSSPDE